MIALSASWRGCNESKLAVRGPSIGGIKWVYIVEEHVRHPTFVLESDGIHQKVRLERIEGDLVSAAEVQDYLRIAKACCLQLYHRNFGHRA